MSDTFTAATWNVYHGTAPAKLRPILRDLRDRGVSLLLLQEVSNADVRAMFVDEGWGLYFHPGQYAIAWLREPWVPIVTTGARLSSTAYWRRGGGSEQYSEAAMGIMCDRAGRTLTAMSYHTPAHVQVRVAPARRVTALRESAAAWRDLAAKAETRAVLFGGDDNVDENGPAWDFLLQRATGLRQVKAPAPTHGHRTRGRRIDDFRVRGLRPGAGEVLPGGGDHRVHLREWSWR